MDYSPVSFVLSTPELLEMILGYVTYGESLEKCCELRLVSKLWRDMISDGLYNCSKLPSVQISKLSPGKIGLSEFKRKFPAVLQIPYVLKIAKQLPITIYKMIAFRPDNLRTIDIKVYRNFVFNVPEGNLDISLPNLQQISIRCDIGERSNPLQDLKDFLDKLIDKTERLKELKLGVKLYANLEPNLYLLSQLTHLDIEEFDCSSHLDAFVDGNLSKLTKLSVTTSTLRLDAFDKINQLFSKQGGGSKTCSLTVTGNHCSLPHMVNLNSLHLRVPMTNIVMTKPLPSLLPNLTKLSTNYSNFSAILKERHMPYEHLKWLVVIGEDCRVSGCLSRISDFLENGLSPQKFPRLERFAWRNFRDDVTSAALPIFSKNLLTLKHLEVSVLFGQDANKQAIKMLTGSKAPTYSSVAKAQRVPHEDEETALQGQPCAITNLADLRKLTLNNEAVTKEVRIDPFLFKAGFLQMPNLWQLDFYGNISVERGCAELWKATNRQILFSQVFDACP